VTIRSQVAGDAQLKCVAVIADNVTTTYDSTPDARIARPTTYRPARLYVRAIVDDHDAPMYSHASPADAVEGFGQVKGSFDLEEEA
jgi:hypothetical protein